MSNALAIASVSRLLKDLLNNAFIDGDISADIGSDVVVSVLPPDIVEAGMNEDSDPQVNLFLHRVTPNPALANRDLPTRDSRFGLTARPTLALDLHYLLTAYSRSEFSAEILLGYAMEMFHEYPVFAREMVRAALAGNLNGALLPPAFQNTDPARLADQIELLRVTPYPLSLDDMSRLWTAFQSNYRTTVAYIVSVVLIARDLPVRTPLPVLSRGQFDPATGRDRGVVVRPDLLPSTPSIDAVLPPGERPALRLGDAFAISGHRLADGTATVRFIAPENGDTNELAPAAATGSRLSLTLPSGPPLAAADPDAGSGVDPGVWRIGPYQVEVTLELPGEPARVTNRLLSMLAPATSPTATAAGGGTRIRVDVEPRIRQEQAVAILAGQAEQALPPLGGNADQVEAVFAGLASGTELPVRVRVAGVDSLVIDPSSSPPRFDPAQVVTVP